ncbi:MAG: hypothetical protein ACODAE_07675, partial [Gemmatimonadota bacterium]
MATRDPLVQDLRDQDPLAGYTPDWRERREDEDEPALPTPGAGVEDDPLAGYSPDWRDEMDAEAGPTLAERRGRAAGRIAETPAPVAAADVTTVRTPEAPPDPDMARGGEILTEEAGL